MNYIKKLWKWTRDMVSWLLWFWPRDSPLPLESVSFWTLNVTVLRAKTKKGLLSQSDLYVTLKLPTATATIQRTKAINNNNEPEWKEHFSFRVPTKTKNILEIRLLDNDVIWDDLISTILLDLATVESDLKSLPPDSKLHRIFTLNPETNDTLELEFELTHRDEGTQEYLSNGILMAAPLSVLSVKVQELLDQHYLPFLFSAPTLTLCGSYETSHCLEPHTDQVRFHMNRELETQLVLTKTDATEEAEVQKKEAVLSTFHIKPLGARQSGNVSLSTDKETVNLHLELRKRGDQDMGVRLSEDVPAQEKEFLQKRRRIVSRALQALLGLKSAPPEDKVPTVAVVASGGGARACTGLLGSLKGLKEMGVLDVVSYITVLSGSTWSMSALCQDENWSQNLEQHMSEIREQMTKPMMSAFSQEQMDYYKVEMKKKEDDGHLVSYVDMEGLIAEHYVFGKKITSTLSDQKKTVKNGQNPLPIYTAVNTKEAIRGYKPESEWVEFTPFEVGMQKYGAFVQAENFDSEFFLGHLVKKLPEIRLPYLIGIWSSALSINIASLRNFLRKTLTGSTPTWTPEDTEVDHIEHDSLSSTLDTILLNPDSSLGHTLTHFFKSRPIINQTFNFTRGLCLHHNYSQNYNFLTWKDTHPDTFPNDLTPSDPTLELIDSGHAINIGCPPVLRPERHADVIIILSYSWDPQDIFDVLKRTCKFCEDHKVPFPSPDFAELQQLPQREVYVCEDPENPNAPIVLYLPLVNASFRDHKAPDVPRQTAEELAAGVVDVNTSSSPYTTKHMTYAEKDYDTLIDLVHYNAMVSRDAIVSALSRALSRPTSDP